MSEPLNALNTLKPLKRWNYLGVIGVIMGIGGSDDLCNNYL